MKAQSSIIVDIWATVNKSVQRHTRLYYGKYTLQFIYFLSDKVYCIRTNDGTFNQVRQNQDSCNKLVK